MIFVYNFVQIWFVTFSFFLIVKSCILDFRRLNHFIWSIKLKHIIFVSTFEEMVLIRLFSYICICQFRRYLRELKFRRIRICLQEQRSFKKLRIRLTWHWIILDMVRISNLIRRKVGMKWKIFIETVIKGSWFYYVMRLLSLLIFREAVIIYGLLILVIYLIFCIVYVHEGFIRVRLIIFYSLNRICLRSH